jgi:hypothetical protein
MDTKQVRRSVYRAILRHNGAVFQTRDLRQELGWAEESPEGRRLHAIIQGLKQQGIIAQTGPARRRHQYLELREPDGLRAEMNRLRTPETLPPKAGAREEVAAQVSGPRRVRYLEERVEELEDQARAHDGKLDEIGRDVSDMKVQLDALYREWVGE